MIGYIEVERREYCEQLEVCSTCILYDDCYVKDKIPINGKIKIIFEVQDET